MIPNQTGKDDWATPQYIVDWATAHLGIDGIGFELDAAAKQNTSKGSAFFGVGGVCEDAFAARWDVRGEFTTVWCNPPYSRAGGGLAKWCARMQAASELEGCIVVGLFFARTETVAWQESVSKSAEVYLIRGRVAFIDPATGNSPGPAPAPSAIVIWRPGDLGPPAYQCLDLRAMASTTKEKK